MAEHPQTHGTPVQYTVVDIRKTGKLIEAALKQAPKVKPYLIKPPPCKSA